MVLWFVQIIVCYVFCLLMDGMAYEGRAYLDDAQNHSYRCVGA